jgi:L-histidine N-alpha-methyltransferase
VADPLSPIVDIHLRPDDLHRSLVADARKGLNSIPKDIPPKWFYDARGSALFDQITRLPEYYPTEAEREVLLREAGAIIATTRPETLIELGSGTSDKTRALLDAATSSELQLFVPFDVSGPFLEESAEALASLYPSLQVHGVVGDFDHHLGHIPGSGRRLIAMLGSTIGNYQPAPRRRLLADIVASLDPGDHLLLGADLVKAVDRLELAYNDPAGVTAQFNLNVLEVMNRELGADFDLDAFRHVARFNPRDEWIEMFLSSEIDQKVEVAELGMQIPFRAGEIMRTEVSSKFRRERLEAELVDVGLQPVAWWTDAAVDFGLSLSVRGD